ncbi:hypothetical protein, partial [Bradyrhizobium sp. TM233]|uniref:hypothetical protein n=1 Tax=Bradyrhizobium sp. TM233 TaxID=2599801 RepID=UPI0030C67F58
MKGQLPRLADTIESNITTTTSDEPTTKEKTRNLFKRDKMNLSRKIKRCHEGRGIQVKRGPNSQRLNAISEAIKLSFCMVPANLTDDR